MGTLTRFLPLKKSNVSVFRFKVDTSLIVSGATNGSENPLTFKIPMGTGGTPSTNCTLQVSDGRLDVIITESNLASATLLNFATAGIYTITLIGRIGNFVGFNSTAGYDKIKMIEVLNWGSDVVYASQCFNGCVNCEFLASNVLTLPVNSVAFFANTKGFPNKDLSNIIVSNVTSATNILANVPTKFNKLFNPFWYSLVNGNNLYAGIDISELQSVEIISNSITTLSDPLNNTIRRTFPGFFKILTPNNTNIGGVAYRISTNPPPLDQVDIRNVTSALNILFSAMSKTNTDLTLLGWANNFDWSGIADIPNKVTFDFKNSTHSNTTEVNNAKNFLISKGYVFTNLTAI